MCNANSISLSTILTTATFQTYIFLINIQDCRYDLGLFIYWNQLSQFKKKKQMVKIALKKTLPKFWLLFLDYSYAQ